MEFCHSCLFVTFVVMTVDQIGSHYEATMRSTSLTHTRSLFKAQLALKWRVQGWRSGRSTRFLSVSLGFNSQTRRHMWVEFVGSLLCTERFSPGTPVFPLSSKNSFDLICVNLQCPQLPIVLQHLRRLDT